MNNEELKDIIVEEILNIAPDVDADDITMDANIQTSLEIDSFDFLNILVALNKRIGVEVPESDYPKVNTLAKMIDYFAHNQKN